MQVEHAKNSPERAAALRCSLCHKDMESSIQLHKHMIRFHKERKCEVCDASFRSWAELQEHKKEHHRGMAQRKRFFCEDCGKWYLKEVHLLAHIRSVHEGVEFVCEKDGCGKVFSRFSALRLHERVVHQRLAPFVCHMCDKAFAYRHVLRGHYEAKHPEQETVWSNLPVLAGLRPRAAHMHNVCISAAAAAVDSARADAGAAGSEGVSEEVPLPPLFPPQLVYPGMRRRQQHLVEAEGAGTARPLPKRRRLLSKTVAVREAVQLLPCDAEESAGALVPVRPHDLAAEDEAAYAVAVPVAAAVQSLRVAAAAPAPAAAPSSTGACQVRPQSVRRITRSSRRGVGAFVGLEAVGILQSDEAAVACPCKPTAHIPDAQAQTQACVQPQV